VSTSICLNRSHQIERQWYYVKVRLLNPTAHDAPALCAAVLEGVYWPAEAAQIGSEVRDKAEKVLAIPHRKVTEI
jgi:hypothetical protein